MPESPREIVVLDPLFHPDHCFLDFDTILPAGLIYEPVFTASPQPGDLPSLLLGTGMPPVRNAVGMMPTVQPGGFPSLLLGTGMPPLGEIPPANPMRYAGGLLRTQVKDMPPSVSQAAIMKRMRKRTLYILVIIFTLLACRVVNAPFSGQNHIHQTSTVAVSATPLSNHSGSSPTFPVSPTDTPLGIYVTPQVSPPFEVRFHPDGNLYIGDQVSMEIIAQPGLNIDGLKAYVYVDRPVGATLGPVEFGYFGIGRRPQATLYWSWDTRGLPAGKHELTFSIDPLGISWTQSVTLSRVEDLPAPEPEAHWATAEIECCQVYYITGTAAERDLPQLLDMIDQQADDTGKKLDYSLNEAVSVVLAPRILGHGGFANQEVSVSYLDRNYTAAAVDIILHHELVHLVDARLGGEWRPSIFVEGLAVYLSGGHFKPEPLLPRAAALLDLNRYIPLESLIDDFYPTQHEIGYLEAGALVEFMVKTWGWAAFSSFYRSMHSPAQGQEPLAVLNQALLEHFQLPLAGVEARFLDGLRNEKVTDDLRADVLDTVDFYDTVRLYQQEFDPSAYFLTAWMLDARQMRERNIVADYLRHPSQPANLALETMLNTAGVYLQQADYERVEELLTAIRAVLNASAAQAFEPFAAHPLAKDYYQIAQDLAAMGFQAQKIMVNGGFAQVWVNRASTELLQFEMQRVGDRWVVVQTTAWLPAINFAEDSPTLAA